MAIQNIRIKVSGKVQGVFFRASTAAEAKKSGLKGFVRNERDGSVYIEAEGDEYSLKLFLKWCTVGPPRAIVDSVSIEEGSLQHYSTFEIIR